MTLGLLFDLDGTMADTDAVHFDAFNILLGEFGRSITPAEFKAQVMGRANAQIMAVLFPEFERTRHAELADRKEALFRSISVQMQPIEGLIQLLDEVRHHDVPVGVVTNAPRANAKHMLTALGLAHLLPTVVIGEEIARSKPDPLPYLTGLAKLGMPAARVIAFEDSIAGVTSAAGAGLYTVGLTTGVDEEALIAAGARLVVRNYQDAGLLALVRSVIAGGEIPGALPLGSPEGDWVVDKHG